MGTERYDELARLVAEARAHFEEFLSGKKIAATRARKTLQSIRRAAGDARKDILTIKKGAAPGETPAVS